MIKTHMNAASQAQCEILKVEKKCQELITKAARMSTTEFCTAVAQAIPDYVLKAEVLYRGDTELQSYMVLVTMELWIAMDKAVCISNPLMASYTPIVQPEVLDVLLLPTFNQMTRLRDVQIYLRGRWAKCGSQALSVFADPQLGCLGHRFYDESSDSVLLQRHRSAIEEHAAILRREKHEEWQRRTQKYEELSRGIAQNTCLSIQDDFSTFGERYHNPTECPRCRLVDQRARMRIQIYEHPLPANEVVAKTVVFELHCPAPLAEYRQASWFVLSRLMLEINKEIGKPVCCIQDYKQLQRFQVSKQNSFCLASTTKSCECILSESLLLFLANQVVLMTHYSHMRFPVQWESGNDRDSVCRPNGLKLAYFDLKSGHWPGRYMPRPSLLHLVKFKIPKCCLFKKQLKESGFTESPYGLSSYEIIASAMTCPAGTNVHEFLNYQNLASGVSRRWPAVLAELGSSNLNFSNESSVTLVKYLATQCGPLGQPDDPFRAAHAIFQDPNFGSKLLDLLNERLESVRSNWRETNLMQMIILLAIRLADLADAAGLLIIASRAIQIVHTARMICNDWLNLLEDTKGDSEDTKIAHRNQEYALWAAILCKQTFCVSSRLSREAVATFIQSNIALQDNLLIMSEKLPINLREAVAHGLRISHQLREQIFDILMAAPDVLGMGLSVAWPSLDVHPRKLAAIKLKEQNWISAQTVAQEDEQEQNVLLNFVEGVLLIDGHRIGVSKPHDPNKLTSEMAVLILFFLETA